MILMMALLLPFSALEMRADDKVQNRKIPVVLETMTRVTRSLYKEVIVSYLNVDFSYINTIVLESLGEIEVTATNTSTGESWSNTFDSMTEHQSFLPISGTPGYYEIEYITEFGDVYAGEFLIE